MFLGGVAGQRLKPVRVACGTAGDRPFLHRMSYIPGNGGIQRFAALDGRQQFRAGRLRQIFAHGVGVEDILSVALHVGGSGWGGGRRGKSGNGVDGGGSIDGAHGL